MRAPSVVIILCSELDDQIDGIFCCWPAVSISTVGWNDSPDPMLKGNALCTEEGRVDNRRIVWYQK